MARIQVTNSEGWKEVSAVSCDFQNDSTSTLRYKFSAIEPAADELGFSLAGGGIRGQELISGLKLWVKNTNETLINVEIATWP